MSTATGSLAARLRAPAPEPGERGRGGLTAAGRLGWAGIVVALVGFLLTLPPITLRTIIPSAVLAVVAVILGGQALRGRERRLGIIAMVLAVGGLGLAYGASRTGTAGLEATVSWGALLAAMLRFATPLTFAALGGLVSERSGVVNIGLEGMMLMGAFFSAYGADKTGSWLLGILIGVLAGMVLAAIHAVFTVSLRADQIVSGTALNFIALGLTGYLYIDNYADTGTPNDLPEVPDIHLPTESLGAVGQAISQQNLLVWVGLIGVVVTWLVVFRTAAGLRLRSVGENPKAAETVGIDVLRTRYVAVITSGALAALGGCFLSIGSVHSFSQNMTSGRGFIALAALIFGRWRPFGLLGATLLFGFSSALGQRLPQLTPGAESASVLFSALPYVLTLVAVAGLIGRSVPPAADGIPYKREG